MGVTISRVSSSGRGRTTEANSTATGVDGATGLPSFSFDVPRGSAPTAVSAAGTGTGGATATNLASTRLCRICSVPTSSGFPTRRQMSARLRRPSTRKKTFHSSGVRVTLCFTRSGLTTASTAISRSGNTSERRWRSSMRRTPSMSRFWRSMSRVTAVAGGGTPSQKLNRPARQANVSKMISDTCTFRTEASSASLKMFSARSACPIRPAFFGPDRTLSSTSAWTLPIRTSIEPSRRSSRVEVA